LMLPNNIVKSNNVSRWWHGLVYAELSPATTQVKIRIRGYPYGSDGFKARIDLALLSVYYYDEESPSYGNATLTASIYYSNVIQHPEWDGFVSLGFGVAAKAADGYSVAKLKDLTVELLPNDGEKTSQAGRLTVLSIHHENSKNFTVNPKEKQEFIEGSIELSQLGFDITMGSAAAIIIAVASFSPEPISKAAAAGWLLISIAVDAGLGTFSHFAFQPVEIYHPIADGGSNYKIWETLDYSEKIQSDLDRVEYAASQCYFDWRFRTDSDDIFAIRVSAVVEWWEWYDPDPWTPGDEYWTCAGETELSIIISIVDYW